MTWVFLSLSHTGGEMQLLCLFFLFFHPREKPNTQTWSVLSVTHVMTQQPEWEAVKSYMIAAEAASHPFLNEKEFNF